MTEKELDKGIGDFWARYWAKYPQVPSPKPNSSAGAVLLVIAAITFIFWLLFGEVR